MRTTRRASGYSFVELVFLVGIATTISAIAVPQVLASVDDSRAVGAVRFLSARIQSARMEAIARSKDVGVRFVADRRGFSFGVYVDKNRNGVRTRDIQQGIDLPIGVLERLPDRFADVDFGLLPNLPPVEAGSAPPGSDPIKFFY